MLQRINIKTLGIAFVLLLILVIVVQVSNSKPERNFRSTLVEIDTTAIQQIEIQSFGKDAIVLYRENGKKWAVKQTEKLANVDTDALKSLILSLGELKIKRQVGAHEKQWGKYEVTDSLATRVRVKSSNGMLADIMVGKFSYKQRGQGMDITTYARLHDEEETYLVDGQLSMMTRRDFNGFRSHVISQVNPDKVTKITASYPADSSFVLQKNGNAWLLAGNAVDSATTYQYLNELKDVKAFNFADKFEATGKDVYKIVVEDLSGQHYEIEAYRDAEKYFMRTSLNENAVFSESKRIFDRLFKSPSYFVKGS